MKPALIVLVVFCVAATLADVKYFRSPPPTDKAPAKNDDDDMTEVQTAAPIRIVQMKAKVNSDGTYAVSIHPHNSVVFNSNAILFEYMYETENGIQMQEQGFTKEGDKVDEKGKKESINVAQGSYSYTSPEGIPISVSYMADENGFQTFENEMPDTTSAGTGGGNNQKKAAAPAPTATTTKPKPQRPQGANNHGHLKAAAQSPYYAYSYMKEPQRDLDEEESEEEEEEEVYPTPNLYRYN